MRRLALLATALLLVLAGCGSSEDDDPPAARQAPSQAPSSARPSEKETEPATEEPSSAADSRPPATSDPKDCFDADCLLKLSEPVTIRLDAEKFYYRAMRVVSVGPEGLSYTVDYPNGGGSGSSLGPGGSSSFGFRSHPGVEVELVSVTDGTALLALSPVKL